MVIADLLELSNAFDTVPHITLLDKLQNLAFEALPRKYILN